MDKTTIIIGISEDNEIAIHADIPTEWVTPMTDGMWSIYIVIPTPQATLVAAGIQKAIAMIHDKPTTRSDA